MTEKKEITAAELGARANIPGSTLRDMAAVDFNPTSELAATRFVSSGPQPMIPQDFCRGVDNRSNPPTSATPGWQAEIPLQPNHHVAACDRLMDAQDLKDKAAAQPSDFERMAAAMTAMMQMQSTTLQAYLRARVVNTPANKGAIMRVQLLATVTALAVTTTVASAYTRHHHKHHAHPANVAHAQADPGLQNLWRP